MFEASGPNEYQYVFIDVQNTPTSGSDQGHTNYKANCIIPSQETYLNFLPNGGFPHFYSLKFSLVAITKSRIVAGLLTNGKVTDYFPV